MSGKAAGLVPLFGAESCAFYIPPAAPDFTDSRHATQAFAGR